jgi:hypothetical protein
MEREPESVLLPLAKGFLSLGGGGGGGSPDIHSAIYEFDPRSFGHPLGSLWPPKVPCPPIGPKVIEH